MQHGPLVSIQLSPIYNCVQLLQLYWKSAAHVFLIFVLRNCLVTLFMPYPYYARPDKLDFVRPECMLANMLVSVEVITTRGYNRFIMLHVVLQATLQQVLTQQWELQKQVDVNASHLEKERHQLAEQIKKVLCYEVCVCVYIELSSAVSIYVLWCCHCTVEYKHVSIQICPPLPQYCSDFPVYHDCIVLRHCCCIACIFSTK